MTDTQFKGLSYNFALNEEIVLDFWNKEKIFEKSLQKTKNNQPFIFCEGPPFSNATPHYGHVLGSCIKDTICRWATQNGCYVPRNPSFDNHGLPLEGVAEKNLNLKTKQDIINYGIANFNEECRKIVTSCSNKWIDTMNRLGRWMSYETPSYTMDMDYMNSVWWVFSTLYEKGLIYEGCKIMPYSNACATPLSNFEAASNYQNVSDRTIIAKFPVKNKQNHYILVWTTTPWTLPSNQALCVNPNLDYQWVEHESNHYLISSNLIETVFKNKNYNLNTTKYKGSTLSELQYEPLYNCVKHQKKFGIVCDHYVKDDMGTGIVHIAPAFGEDDFRVGLDNNLISKETSSLFLPLTDNGLMTKDVDFLEGKTIKESNNCILKNLQNRDLAFNIFEYNHEYPFCWRTDTPLIYRAVSSWFIKVTDLKEKLLINSQKTNWVPQNIRDKQFTNWLENVKDWCISRNRFWGTPLPIWKSDDGDILCIKSKQELEQLTDTKLSDLHRHFIDHLIIEKNGKKYRRSEHVLDCWLESGSMPFAQVGYPYKTQIFDHPADFIAEGIDQFRCWFYVLHVLSTALFDKPAFKNVVVNGIMLGEDGKKLSKRHQNYTDVMQVINKYGSDVLRFYLVTSPSSKAESMKFSTKSLDEISSTVLIPLANSFNFYFEFHTKYIKTHKEFRELTSTNPLDHWIMHQTNLFVQDLQKYYKSFNLSPIHNLLLAFIDKLNNNYICFNREAIKGKTDCEINSIFDGDLCRMGLTTLQKVLFVMITHLAPILPFFCEHYYQKLSKTIHDLQIQSIHLISFDYHDSKINYPIQSIEKVTYLVEISHMIRKLRSDETVKLSKRKPIKSITIKAKKETIENISDLERFISSENNILKIYWDNWNPIQKIYQIKPNIKEMGKKLKKDKDKLLIDIKNFTQDQIITLISGQHIQWNNYELTSDLFIIDETFNHNNANKILINENLQLSIEIDVTQDETTQQLFVLRELVSNFQKLRKYAGLHPWDPVNFGYHDNPLKKIIETDESQNYVKKMTGCQIYLSNQNIELQKKIYEKVIYILEQPIEIFLFTHP